MKINLFIEYMRLRYAKKMRDFYDEYIYNDDDNIRQDISIFNYLRFLHWTLEVMELRDYIKHIDPLTRTNEWEPKSVYVIF